MAFAKSKAYVGVPTWSNTTLRCGLVNPNAEIEQQTTDSTTGITSAIDGKCDIGMASRDLKEEETGVKATKIALDGIAVIVNNDNPTDEISSDMVKQIFTGEVTKWQDVK